MQQTINKEHIIEKITRLTVLNQLVETIFVNDSNGEIEICETNKEGGIVKRTVHKISYKLQSHRMIVKSCNQNHLIISDSRKSRTISTDKCVCDCAAEDVNSVFISELKSSKRTIKEEFKLFSQSFLKKILNKNTDQKLIKKIIQYGEGSSWMIVPKFILDIVKESKEFSPVDCVMNTLISYVGKLGDISIYLNTQSEEVSIFFGNYDSLTVIINKNIRVDDTIVISNVYDSGKKISVDYLFIENSPIKMLNII